jgi:hypothetical protein
VGAAWHQSVLGGRDVVARLSLAKRVCSAGAPVQAAFDDRPGCMRQELGKYMIIRRLRAAPMQD